MENKNYGERQEGRNNAERVSIPKGRLEEKLYSQGDKYFVYDQLKYGGENGR